MTASIALMLVCSLSISLSHFSEAFSITSIALFIFGIVEAIEVKQTLSEVEFEHSRIEELRLFTQE